MPCRIKDNFPNNHIKPDKMATVSSWYRNNMVPTIPSLEKICTAFGITLSLLFAEEDKGEIAMKIKYFVLGAVSVALVGALAFGAYQMGLHAAPEEPESPAVSAQPSAEVDISEEADPLVVLPAEDLGEIPEESQAEEPVTAPEPVSEPEKPTPEPEAQASNAPQQESPADEPVPREPAPEPTQPVSAPVIPAAPQKPAAPLNEGTAFEGHAVTVNDWTTPAVFSGGKDWPITIWYFFDENNNILGSISGESAMKITQQYPSGNIEWAYWFAEAFNDFREVSGEVKSAPKPSSAGTSEPEERESSVDYDPWELALEVVALTNEEREEAGLNTLEVDDDLMELAMIRAEEVSRKYSHERPDGTRISKEYGYGENCGAKASPEKQVNSWMNSDGHRTNILLERYNYIGVGCYRSGSGTVYWVQVFSP